MTETRRIVGGSARASQQGQRQFIAKVLSYYVADSYGTVWLPGCFADSMRQRMPRIAWAHSWIEPIGQYVSVVADNAKDGLVLLGQLDDFDAVPRARQAYAQLKSGTIDQFSVGFDRQEWRNPTSEEEQAWPGVTEVMIRADLSEASLVLEGAVPGTALLSVRSRAGRGLSPTAAALVGRHRRRTAAPDSFAVRAVLADVDEALRLRRR